MTSSTSDFSSLSCTTDTGVDGSVVTITGADMHLVIKKGATISIARGLVIIILELNLRYLLAGR